MTTVSMVLDASVALAWLLGRADARESLLAEHLLEVAHDAQSTVPPIWHLEIANSMLRAERSRLASRDQLASFTQRLKRLPIFPDLTKAALQIPNIYQLAHRHALTAYDASCPRPYFTPYFVRYASTASRFSANAASSCSRARMSVSDAIATTGMP